MTEKEFRAKHLYKFLYSHNLIYKFIGNLSGRKKDLELFQADHDFIGLLVRTYNIDQAFLWSETEQGHKFWSKLNLNEILSYDREKSFYLHTLGKRFVKNA